jgi:predicted transcriptional regulator
VRLTDIMSTKLVVLTLEHTIKEAAQIFLDNQIDGAPVVNEKGELLGLLTKSHIYRVIAQDQNPASLVGDIMNPDLTVGHPDEEVRIFLIKWGVCQWWIKRWWWA